MKETRNADKPIPPTRRARPTDADAEVNAPGESRPPMADAWSRRSQPMPGRTSTVKGAPWRHDDQEPL